MSQKLGRNRLVYLLETEKKTIDLREIVEIIQRESFLKKSSNENMELMLEC